jgi:kynureninase
MHEDLLRWRAEFPILERKTYLINNSLGAMPRRTRDRLGEFADSWDVEGVMAWDRWLPLVTEVGDLVGRILGAPPKTVMMHQNVSTLQAILASCYDFQSRRKKIVFTELNFPSVAYVWLEQRRRGAEVTIVKSDDGISVPTERLLDAIDDNTLLVPISHVLFRSSAIQDVKAIIEKAHQVGARVCIDSYQATGCIPFDVVELGVDLCVGGSVKWLCGGPGAAYLYVREDLIPKMRPAACGWFSHARPFGFEMGAIDYAEDIHRVMGGSPSVPALYSARSGYEIILEVGVAKIRERSLHLTRRILDRAVTDGLTINTPTDDAHRGGTICVDFEGSEACSKWLIDRGIVIDWRPGAGIRISPHFYNTEAECDLVMDAIAEHRRAAA